MKKINRNELKAGDLVIGRGFITGIYENMDYPVCFIDFNDAYYGTCCGVFRELEYEIHDEPDEIIQMASACIVAMEEYIKDRQEEIDFLKQIINETKPN